MKTQKSKIQNVIKPKQGDVIKFWYLKYDSSTKTSSKVIAIGQAASLNSNNCVIVNDAVYYPNCQKINFKWGGAVVQFDHIIAIV